MRLNTSLKQQQKAILAPSMQQSIEILQLPILELNTVIEQELQENPLLEVDETVAQSEQSSLEDLIYENLKNSTESKYQGHVNPDDDIIDEKAITKTIPLEDFLLEQLRLEFSDPLDIEIGELIIGNLNEDGYLQITCEEIAIILRLSNLEHIQKILRKIQHFEPLGIAAHDIKECLLIQSSFLFNGESPLINEIIASHFEDIGRRKYNIVAREMKISEDKVKELTKKISKLEPRPARKYRFSSSNIYVKPDIHIFKDTDGQFQVTINEENIPKLRISNVYQRILKQRKLSEEEKIYIREKIKNALIFMKSIQQRHQTLRRIAEYIVSEQRPFFDQGHMAIKPMILKDVAQAVERNESTISRAINNKYVNTPQGLLPMKFFFSQSISSDDDAPAISNRSVKEELKTLIHDEDKDKPLSDQAIQTHLQAKGLKVARRTISKYRKMLNILPSNLRKSNN